MIFFVSKKCTFGDLKHTEYNVLCHRQCQHKFSSIYHSNISFTDKKAFIVHDLFKLRVRRSSITGWMPELWYCHNTHTRKRCNIMCVIRPFNVMPHNKSLACVIADQNGTAELSQKHLKLKLRIGFIKKGDMLVHDNSTIHVDRDKTEVKDIFHCLGICIEHFPACSPKLNLI